jgi:hypothetical protein
MDALCDSIADDLIVIYQYVNDICYVCPNYTCILFINMRQFINDYVLFNYLKK